MDCRTERKLSLLKETNFGLQFSVSPRPLGFGFGTKRFGAKGLGIKINHTVLIKNSEVD